MAVRAAKDEIRAARKERSHVRQAIKPVIGVAAKRMPSAVATPLPPLNLSQMGKQWPTIAPRPKSKANSGVEYRLRRKIGSAPFAASRRRVARASFLLPVRRTFVAPILPEPIVRRSVSPNRRVRMRPNGIEPAR